MLNKSRFRTCQVQQNGLSLLLKMGSRQYQKTTNKIVFSAILPSSTGWCWGTDDLGISKNSVLPGSWESFCLFLWTPCDAQDLLLVFLLKIIPGGALRNCLRWQGPNLGWLCTRQVPYSLYYLSYPKSQELLILQNMWSSWFRLEAAILRQVVPNMDKNQGSEPHSSQTWSHFLCLNCHIIWHANNSSQLRIRSCISINVGSPDNLK